MANGQIGAKEWLTKNRREMICCPYQPGQLMISKSACSKRHALSRKENFGDIMKGDLFNYAYKMGLSVCRDCPIGEKLAISGPTARFQDASCAHRAERPPTNNRAGGHSQRIIEAKNTSR